MLTWIISTVESNAVESSTKHDIQNEIPNNVEFFRDVVSPITHMEFGVEKRTRRNSEFDRGYNEFLRNYHNDNAASDRRGRYQVNESDESESDESSSTSDEDDDDNGESESSESDENRKKYKSKASGKNKKAEQNAAKKKSKHCKTEKRGNMLCNICYNPKNDEKKESCSYNSDPKDKNYEYSEDSSYSTKDKQPESLEEDDSDSENDESDESRPAKKKHPPAVNRHPPPGNNRHLQYGPRFYLPRQHPNQNYGPQTFIPQAFQPISLRPTGSRPIRIQIKSAPPSPPPGPPPTVALIRYRTIETPFGSQHIRLITYPSGPPPSYPQQNHSNRPPQQYNRRPVSAAQEQRPPRDINPLGAHSESLVSNVTKEHQFEHLPNHSLNGANREYAAFMSKERDGSRCRKAIENDQICFECYVDGERRKECMYANVRPDNFYKSYSMSKKFNNYHPYKFDLPIATVSKHSMHSQQKSKSHSSKQHNKNKDYSAEQFGGNSGSDEYYNSNLKYEIPKNHVNDWDFHHSDKDEQRPQAQPLHSSISDVIYGRARPGPEPLALFFQTDPTIFNNINSNNNNTNYNSTNTDVKISTNSTKLT